VNAGGDSGAMAGNGYEKIIAIDLLLVSFRDVSRVQRRSRNLSRWRRFIGGQEST
jgi:hypothetical protein